MTHYFISDLHLTPAQPELSRSLKYWVQRVSAHARSVFILGDLVDVWLGDDDDSAWKDQLLEIFHPFRERRIPCHFLPGNRDFLLGEMFCRAAGWVLLPDPYRMVLGEHHVLLTHGDALCVGDQAYQAFRRQVRDAGWQAGVLQRPLAERRQLARELREASDLHNRSKSQAIMDVDPTEALRWMQTHGVDTLIHGHTHRPGRHPCGDDGMRYVLGDWRQDSGQVDAQMLCFGHRGFELRSIQSPPLALTP